MKSTSRGGARAKPAVKCPRPIPESAREYLQYIGALGGLTSRRDLASNQARRMVAIREAKRALIKQGKPELARDRWPLKVKAEYTDIRKRMPKITAHQLRPLQYHHR